VTKYDHLINARIEQEISEPKETLAFQPQSGHWLLDAGLKQLELLFRAIVDQPAEPFVIADNDGTYRNANCGAGRLFGLRAPLGELWADAVETAGDTLADIERHYNILVPRETGGVISAAAARLGVPRTTLNVMMRKLGISRQDL